MHTYFCIYPHSLYRTHRWTKRVSKGGIWLCCQRDGTTYGRMGPEGTLHIRSDSSVHCLYLMLKHLPKLSFVNIFPCRKFSLWRPWGKPPSWGLVGFTSILMLGVRDSLVWTPLSYLRLYPQAVSALLHTSVFTSEPSMPHIYPY